MRLLYKSDGFSISTEYIHKYNTKHTLHTETDSPVLENISIPVIPT